MSSASVKPEKPASYEILAKLIDEPGRELYHVKLPGFHLVRELGKAEYFEVTHVKVGIARLSKSDQYGTFVYEETTVVAADDDPEAPAPDAMLYYVQRQLTVPEAMFAIGYATVPVDEIGDIDAN